jgi:hypothetical protein
MHGFGCVAFFAFTLAGSIHREGILFWPFVDLGDLSALFF